MRSLPASTNQANPARGGRCGLLLVGHGTRSVEGRRELLRTAELVAAREPQRVVEPAFLELAQPTIAEGVRRLLAQGVDRFTVMPLLLFAAGHAKRDIPLAVSADVEGAQVDWRQAPHLGCHAKILELSRLRFHEALAGHAPLPPGETLLVLVGRGSMDDAATAEMHQFAALRAATSDVARVEPCFLAMARPTVREALERAVTSGMRRIVVQPHLLFHGDLSRNLSEIVDSIVRKHSGERYPGQEWILTAHLGPTDLLVDAVVDLAPDWIANTI